MRESLEGDSNVTLERDLHSLKQRYPRSVTDEGMQKDKSDEACHNMPLSIEERPRRTEGKQNDESDEQRENA
jgi:hypothetical protein